MPKRIRRGRKFWAPLVEEFEEAGTTEGHREFAARHKVLCGSFERWLYRLRAERKGHPWRGSRSKRGRSVAPVPLPLVEVQGVQVADRRFEVELPGEWRLRVPAGFDAEALRRLLELLSEAVS